MRAFRAYVVEEVPLVRDGLAGWLRLAGLEVVGFAEDGVRALRDFEDIAMDLVVLGPDVRGADDLCRLVSTRIPAPRCLTVVPRGGSAGVFEALRTRTEYVFGDVDFVTFRDAVAAALEGAHLPRATLAAVDGGCSPADHAVLALLAAGLSNREVAEEMGMSLSWVKVCVSRLMTRLSARSRTELVALAVRDGMVSTTAVATAPYGGAHGVTKGQQ